MAMEITSAVLGIAGSLMGVWIGGKISRNANRELLQHQAENEFAAAFSEVLTELYLGHEAESGFARDLLTKHFAAHHTAYQKLRLLLSPVGRMKLDTRWDQYANDKKSLDLRERDLYRFSEVFSMESTADQNSAAINRINRLLLTS